jgi:hypothetical protein
MRQPVLDFASSIPKIQRMFVTCRLLLVLAVALSFVNAAAQTNPEARLALIIGNATYKSSPLSNPVNDARLMDKVLKDAGFTTIKAENASIRDMRRLVRDFGDRLKASGGVGLFYYAGHGVQVRGENFLVSTDSDIRNEDEVADDSVNVSVILDKMQSAGNRMNLIILDACRDNPFVNKSRSSAAGLATINAPSGSLVAYATAPGSVASDGKGQNGLYTEYLAKAMQQPGLAVEEVFKQVRTAVRLGSNNKQTPWENTALEGQFYFKAPLPQVVAAPPPVARPAPEPVRAAAPDPLAVDMAFWDSVKTSQRSGELQAYLKQFPNGLFAALAKMRMDEIKTLAAAPPPKPIVEPKPNLVATSAEPKPALPPAASLPPQIPAVPAKPAQEQRPGVLVASIESKPAASTPQLQALLPNPSQAPLAAGVLGTLVLTNTMFGTKSEMEIRVTESTALQTVYSSGDAVGKDGKVLKVRVGDVVLRATSGALWTLPLKDGASGEAEVEREGVNPRSVGNLSWKAVAMAGGKFRVDAKVTYSAANLAGVGRFSVFGNWSATYGNQGELSESSSAVLRGAGPGFSNMVSIEYKPR